MRRVVPLLPVLLVLAATAKAAEQPASALDGDYDGVFSLHPRLAAASKCR
jgi:hypothetical protein